MKTEQVLLGFQRDLDRGAKVLDKGDVALRELRERPGPGFSLVPARLFTHRCVLARDQPGISIAHHDRAVQFAQPRKCLGWLRSPLQDSAQTHQLLGTLSPNILKHLIKRETVTVIIGNNSKTHGSIPFLKCFALMAGNHLCTPYQSDTVRVKRCALPGAKGVCAATHQIEDMRALSDRFGSMDERFADAFLIDRSPSSTTPVLLPLAQPG